MVLPKWKAIGPQSYPTDATDQPLPPEVMQIWGPEGQALFDAMLKYNSIERIQPHIALLHPFLCRDSSGTPPGSAVATRHTSEPDSHQSPAAAESCTLVPDIGLKLWQDNQGHTSFQGERAPWKLQHGSLQPDVLKFLREDCYLKTCAAELQHKELQSFENPKDNKNKKESLCQKQCKMIISGGFDNPSSKSLNGLSIGNPFPMKRVAAWRYAFMELNSATFSQLDKD